MNNRNFFSAATPVNIGLLVCFVAMLGCVAFEGAFLTLGSLGALSPMPLLLAALYWGWVPLLIGTFLYFKWPIATLSFSWVFFLLSSFAVWTYMSNDHSVVWFLYQHSLELGYIAFSHAGYFLLKKRRRSNPEAEMASLQEDHQ